MGIFGSISQYDSGSSHLWSLGVQTNAATFFTKLSTKHLDFRLGVITTGSNELASDGTKCSMTPSGHKAWDLWGTGWTTSGDGSTAFVNNVSAVGIAGCGSDETAPFFMERALGVHTGVAATVVPRVGAKLVFVILSDEGDVPSWKKRGSAGRSRRLEDVDMRVLGRHIGHAGMEGRYFRGSDEGE